MSLLRCDKRIVLLSCILRSFPFLSNRYTYRISVKKAGSWRRFFKITWMSLSLTSVGSFVNYTLDVKRYCVHRGFKKSPRFFSLYRLHLILIFEVFPLEYQRPESLWHSEHFSKVKYVTRFGNVNEALCVFCSFFVCPEINHHLPRLALVSIYLPKHVGSYFRNQR